MESYIELLRNQERREKVDAACHKSGEPNHAVQTTLDELEQAD